MRISFEGRWFRFEVEFGAPVWRQRRCQALPRKTRLRMQERLWREVAAELHRRRDATWTN